MSKNIFYSILFLMWGVFFAFVSVPSFALQSGGVEIGDLETGSVVGQPFTKLKVQATFTAMCVGGHKAWYSSLRSMEVAGLGSGAPVLIKVKNLLPIAQGFRLSADPAFASPSSISIPPFKVKPGETKYIGIPLIALTSDLTFVTAPQVLYYDSHTDSKMLGGQLIIK